MYFLSYSVKPSKTHPERQRYGDAWVNCWIDRKTLRAADQIARREIEEQNWDIVERETAEVVTADSYAQDDINLQYYEQALVDETVFVYHLSPRYPVFGAIAEVEQDSTQKRCSALYLITGESLLQKGEESVAELNFWDDARRDKAISAAREAIKDAGWKVISIHESWPCGRDDLAEDMRFYFDEAEENGACLVFIHDSQPDAGGE
ncbi:MAG: hypothetical protein L0241_26605 [Planctomycetia bacterium]|nr:hypothetical protein [Planctomycetia bacterium]